MEPWRTEVESGTSSSLAICPGITDTGMEQENWVVVEEVGEAVMVPEPATVPELKVIEEGVMAVLKLPMVDAQPMAGQATSLLPE